MKTKEDEEIKKEKTLLHKRSKNTKREGEKAANNVNYLRTD